MRLGQDQIPPGFRCVRRSAAGNRCHQPLDPRADHAHRCHIEAWRRHRHDAVQHVIAAILRENGIGVREHPVRVPMWDRLRPDGSWQQAVLDLRIEQGPGGPVRYADVVVSHPVGPTNTRAAADLDGATAAAAERDKHDRYGPGVLPLSIETFGKWGPAALKWWRALAKQVVANDPNLAYLGRWAIPSLLQRWWARVSAALQRANAEGVLASIGEVRGSGERGAAGDCDSYELLQQGGDLEA